MVRLKMRSRAGAAGVAWVVILVAVAVVITIAAAMNHRHGAQAVVATQPPAQPVPAAIMTALASVPAATWEHAGTQGATVPTFVGGGDSTGSTPLVLYIGAGFCPYCAAARWSVVTALSRFGTFTSLTLDSSSPVDVFPSTPTFSFYGSSYTSRVIIFDPVEESGDVQLPNGHYNTLETPNPAQEALLDKYDAPPYVSATAAGGIPFILVGGKYMWSGSPYNPSVLAGKSQGAIAATLAQGSGDAAQAILSNANEITATICAVDGAKPANVCSAAEIQRAIKALPTKTP